MQMLIDAWHIIISKVLPTQGIEDSLALWYGFLEKCPRKNSFRRVSIQKMSDRTELRAIVRMSHRMSTEYDRTFAPAKVPVFWPQTDFKSPMNEVPDGEFVFLHGLIGYAGL
jgi:hypothetical protein